MTCTEMQANISRLLDNELPDGRQSETFSHLSGCPSCREFFHGSRFVRRHLEELPPFPEEIDARVAEAAFVQSPAVLHTRETRYRRSLRNRTIRVPLPAAAAILLMLGASLFFAVDAVKDVRSAEENVIYVPTLPEVQVEATIADTHTVQEDLP